MNSWHDAVADERPIANYLIYQIWSNNFLPALCAIEIRFIAMSVSMSTDCVYVCVRVANICEKWAWLYAVVRKQLVAFLV